MEKIQKDITGGYRTRLCTWPIQQQRKKPNNHKEVETENNGQ